MSYCLQMYIFLFNNKKNMELLPELNSKSIIFSTFAVQLKIIFGMTKKFLSLMLLSLFIFTIQLGGQTTNYPTKTVQGIDYYIYTVQTSEGLLAIGRKFEISADEIVKVNPDVKSGLKPGQKLLIPIQKKAANEPENVVLTEFIKHTVEKKQTLFAISHKYKISQEDIEKYNPEVKNGLKDGMVLNIPDSSKIKRAKSIEKQATIIKKTEIKNTEQTKHSFFTHKVLAKETLFSICKQYSVDIKDVVKLNPGADSKISVDSELKIPLNNTNKTHLTETVDVSPAPVENEVKPAEKAVPAEHFTEKKIIKIAFLLPFMLEQAKKEAVLERFQNFYAGALLAIQSAKERGISFEIFTYDTDKTEDKINELLNNDELKTVDLIIGPAFSNQVPLIGRFALENKLNTLIPFSSKVPDIENNPYLFQFNPGFDTEIKYLTEQFNGKLKNVHVVFAEIQGISTGDEGKIRAGALKSYLLKQRKSIGIVELNSPDNAGFNSQLKAGEKNLIIFNTDKFSNISPYLNALNSLPADNNVLLYEPYSWRNQLDKKPDCMHITPFLSSLNEDLLDEYNSQFEIYFGKDLSNESPRYDMLGFDLTNYFISYIHKFGSKYAAKIGTLNSIPYIQSQLNFERISHESGFVNQTLYSAETKTH